MTIRNIVQSGCAVLALIALAACGDSPSSGKSHDTPTSGQINVVCDENYKPLIESELMVFASEYKKAQVNMTYLPEKQTISALVKDSVPCAVMTRPLTAAENAFYQQRGYEPKVVKLGYDGLALITHPDNPVNNLNINQLKGILTGQLSQWSEVGGNSPKPITLVFDNPGSSNVTYCMDSICGGAKLSQRVFAAKNNVEVIDYVALNKDAIGIVGNNYLSDRDDPEMITFLKKIKVLGISKNPNEEAVQPFPAYVANGTYPLRRTIYYVNGQPYKGLGVGLSAFLVSDKGQRIILKAGLVPANAPLRLIKTRKNL